MKRWNLFSSDNKEAKSAKSRLAFQGGSYSLAVAAILLAILIALNILVSALPASATRYDISASKLYSITSNTKVVVNALEEDVTIYWIVQSGAEDDVIETLLSKYDSLSDHITVVKKTRTSTPPSPNSTPTRQCRTTVWWWSAATAAATSATMTSMCRRRICIPTPTAPPSTVRAPSSTTESTEETITAYARINDSQIVYKISGSSYEALKACTYNDLRHTEVLTADFSDVTGFGISLDGQVYTITSKGSGEDKTFLYGDEELDIASLQSALTAVSAQDFTDEAPTQKEELGMTVTLDSETHPKVQIEFYRYDGEHCLAVVDGTPFALVARSAVVDLIEAINTIVL